MYEHSIGEFGTFPQVWDLWSKLCFGYNLNNMAPNLMINSSKDPILQALSNDMSHAWFCGKQGYVNRVSPSWYKKMGLGRFPNSPIWC